jgi:SAM-dependent methyltransferase
MASPSSSTWRPERDSYRRFLLDRALETAAPLKRGTVVDLGGKRMQKRGEFRPPEGQAERWIYVNLARQTGPDLVADAGAVPLRAESADCVICTEVLEHLADPAACVREAHRLLRPRGVMIASVPFLYPIHGDPSDYQRFTADGLRRLFSTFGAVTITPMGGFPGTLGMLLELGVSDGPAPSLGARIGRRLALGVARALCRQDLRRTGLSRDTLHHTTGYFTVGVK